MTKSELWVKENIIEDVEDIQQIAELGKKALYDKISLDTGSYETTIALYASIFNTIVKVLASKRKENDTFSINIANRLEIGYTTTDDDSAEKSGNFMVYMKHLDGAKNDTVLDEDEEMTIVLATQWNSVNVTEQTEVIKEIATEALAPLQQDTGIRVANPELIIPTFCIIHEQIVAYAKLKSVDSEDYEIEINVAGLYNIKVTIDEDGNQKVVYPQNIDLKLKFKSDADATAKYED